MMGHRGEEWTLAMGPSSVGTKPPSFDVRPNRPDNCVTTYMLWRLQVLRANCYGIAPWSCLAKPGILMLSALYLKSVHWHVFSTTLAPSGSQSHAVLQQDLSYA